MSEIRRNGNAGGLHGALRCSRPLISLWLALSLTLSLSLSLSLSLQGARTLTTRPAFSAGLIYFSCSRPVTTSPQSGIKPSFPGVLICATRRAPGQIKVLERAMWSR